MVTGGHFGDGYLDSTELLRPGSEWQEITARLPRPMDSMSTVLISEHFKVCYGVLKVGISLHRFHVFAVKLFVTSLPAQVKKCWGSICFLICLPAGNQSCGMRSRNTVTPQ